MRPSRLLAGLLVSGTLALGGVAFGAPTAHANAVCDAYIEQGFVYDAQGNSIITNNVGAPGGVDVGCVRTRHTSTGGTSLLEVIVNPGWSYRVKSSGGSGSGSKVAVEFTNTTLKLKSSYMIRAGKVVSG